MKLKKLAANAVRDSKTEEKTLAVKPKAMGLKVQTSVRAGDVYMHQPRGSN